MCLCTLYLKDTIQMNVFNSDSERSCAKEMRILNWI